MSAEHKPQSGLHVSSMGEHLFQNSPDCVKLLSDDGNILAMNRNGLCAMEIDDISDFEGAPWKSFWGSESHDAIVGALTEAASGGTGHFTGFCPTAKGSPRWWDVIVTQFIEPDSGVRKLLAVSRDITDSHNAQLELKASEARLRSVVSATSAILWNCPRTGFFEVQQLGWEQFTGQVFDEYKHEGWLSAVHVDDRATAIAAWEQACAALAPFQLQHRLLRADGQYRHMTVMGIPIFDEAGTFTEWVGIHTDITGEISAAAERDRLLREIRATNDRMSDIFRQAPSFMCVLSGADHVFEIVNDRYMQLIGNRHVIGQPVRTALPEVEGQGFFELLDQVYKTGQPFVGNDMPVMLQREPGAALQECFIDLTYTAMRDADGKIFSLLAHGVDQTHRVLADRAMHATQERFEKIVSQAATGVVEMNMSGEIIFSNQRYAEMLGYSVQEIIGLKALALTAPAWIQRMQDTISAAIADGVSTMLTKQYVRRDGSLMPATSSISTLRNPDGSCHGLVAIVVDMTENERVTQELQASEERYRTLFEFMDQGFCIIEIISDESGSAVDYRFMEMNSMFVEHTGLENALGKTALELVPNLDKFWIETYGKVAKTGEATRFENFATAMHRWFDVYATRIGGTGSSRVALLFSDITARKQANETLRKLAADLSEADRRKTEFLATLAHELRNPLAPIRSGLNVVRLSGENPGVVSKVHVMMERQVGHMVHLIDDLLDVARISGGKLTLNRTPVELAPIVASAIETSMPMIESGRHSLHVDVPEVGFLANVDIVRIAQVVANLLNNSAKYTPDGGKIQLILRREASDAVLSITDTGVGIPSAALAGVFDMFSQVGSSLERAQGGLGIGLSLVRRLVEMHGGSVSAESEGKGQGSTFTIKLPLMPKSELSDSVLAVLEGEETHALSMGFDILVVDDNVDAAMTLSMLLELAGHITKVAHDGVEALEILKRFKPRLAFVDIGMPRMNGYETATEIRRLTELDGMVLVALTGWGADSDRSRSKDAGFNYHLTKPVQMESLEQLLAGIDSTL